MSLSGVSNMSPKLFQEIQSTDGLLNFLQSRTHDYYYHFTTVSTFIKILESRRWRFSSGAMMNDQHEYKIKSAPGVREKIFSTCFSFGDKNNMAMWAMYSIPWEDAVRIRIPKETMLKWVKKLQTVKHPELTGVSLHDILYIDGKIGKSHLAKFYWARGKRFALTEPDGKDVSLSPRFTGYLKNSAWKHEQEARLAVTLRDYPSNSFFDLPVPAGFFGEIQITTGPWTSDMDFARQQKRIINAAPIKYRDHFRQSMNMNAFRGQIILRRHCDKCRHEFKEKAGSRNGR